MTVDNNENVAIALAMVFGAGASTGLGAAVVFFPSIVKLASQRVLAASLGFSAGVMTYVSFVEIFIKSYVGFEDAGYATSDAYIYSTLCFFGGVVLMILLNMLVAKLLGEDGHSHHHAGPVNPVTQQKKEDHRSTQLPSSTAKISDQEVSAKETSDDNFVENMPVSNDDDGAVVVGDVEEGDGSVEESSPQEPLDEEKRRLIKMGLNTALAIALHNFPEGLATFVAAVDDPNVGAVLAFALAIYKIS
mmetsp:Transcript_39660/g.95823  ORF Transcript_39660/g.95823 Transcript_39660/m.95823 type:complete len:247 (+) Transcript_39660:111-851(+)